MVDISELHHDWNSFHDAATPNAVHAVVRRELAVEVQCVEWLQLDQVGEKCRLEIRWLSFEDLVDALWVVSIIYLGGRIRLPNIQQICPVSSFYIRYS